MNAEDCIFYQISKTSQFARKFLTEKIKDTDVTVGQGVVLNFLFEENGITINDLAAKTIIDNATMTGLIDRLEQAGLIERKKDPRDRRAYLIHLTDKGRDAGKQIQKNMVTQNKEFLSILTKSEEKQFRHLLKKVRDQSL